MSRARRSVLSASAAALLAVIGCGGAQKGATAPSSVAPQRQYDEAPSGATSTSPGTLAPSPTATASVTSTAPAPGFAPAPHDLLFSNVVTAEQALDGGLSGAANDCVTACRALGSMDRATGQLCALSGAAVDQPQCDDAKGRLLRARDRVRSSCGGCPGGPSVDRNAPIPSMPSSP
jgi:hypothetical protein